MSGPRPRSKPERAIRSELARLAHGQPLVCGSLVTMRRTCGNKRCRCMRGHKHESLYLSVRMEGQRRMVYVPGQWEPRVRAWVAAWRQMKELSQELSARTLASLLEGKRAGTGRRRKEREQR